MLSLEEARARILESLPPPRIEIIPLSLALNRYAAEDILSPLDLPGFDNSSMDGYAVRAEDLKEASLSHPILLSIIGTVPAGQTFSGKLERGECIRIFTGSPLPHGADAVVMQEDVTIDSDPPEKIVFREPVKAWENVRLRGEDVRRFSLLLQKGDRFTPINLALLGAAGIAQLAAASKPTVGVLATGSELREPGEILSPGQIYESNRLLVEGLVTSAGASARIYPIVHDSLEETRIMIQQAFAECDWLITTGGVSVGEFDFVKAAFESLGGKLEFWKVALRPGKPFVFGRIGGKFLFGLPGNPVSAAVTFLLLVRPVLLRMLGASQVHLPERNGILGEPVINHGDRRHFIRVCLDREGQVHSAGSQASHMLSSLRTANGLLDVPPSSRLEAGSKVKVLFWE